MKLLERNKKTIYYATVASVTARYDDYGNETGSPLVNYSTPISADMVLSGTSGTEPFQPFGIGKSYSVVGITDDMNCGIDEQSILWIDSSTSTPNDYVCVGVAKTLDSIKYAFKEVSKS